MTNEEVLNFHHEENRIKTLITTLKDPKEMYKAEDQLLKLRVDMADKIIEEFQLRN